MVRSQRPTDERIAEAKEAVDECNQKIQAYEDLQTELKEAENVGDTRLSKLFHECRTHSKDNWSSASAFLNIEDGKVVVDHVSKIREGSWRPETKRQYDTVLSHGIRPFLESDMFKTLIDRRLSDRVQRIYEKKYDKEQLIKDLERQSKR